MADSHPLIRALARATMAYPFKMWGFGEGIALEALWLADELAPGLGCRRFVLDRYETWLARGIEERDHSASGVLLLDLYQHTGDSRCMTRALELAEYLRGLPITMHGAALHRPQHPDYHAYLYVDCMEVDAPFLCRLGAITGDATWTDAGAAQIRAYCALLQDNASGLFYHQYDAETGTVNGAFWGRGNGWALLGLIKTLGVLPAAHAAFPELAARFRRLASALVTRQLPSGGWPTVLDQPNTYEESSLAAMFGLGLALGIEQRLIDHGVRSVVDRAWSRTVERLADGSLDSVSVATPPGDAGHYAQIATGRGYPWGQGPALWLALLMAPPASAR
ncbi:MAG: glycoside hydrolase family 88 protein [Anaerolineae bacterium]|nr:glycoside hydrolase family 88 protein [Anaerolineae bacterium]